MGLAQTKAEEPILQFWGLTTEKQQNNQQIIGQSTEKDAMGELRVNPWPNNYNLPKNKCQSQSP